MKKKQRKIYKKRLKHYKIGKYNNEIIYNIEISIYIIGYTYL